MNIKGIVITFLVIFCGGCSLYRHDPYYLSAHPKLNEIRTISICSLYQNPHHTETTWKEYLAKHNMHVVNYDKLKKISVEDFNKVYKNAHIQAVRQYGYNLNKVAHLLNLEAQTWDLMILLHETEKRKIKISNKDIVANIENE